MTTFFWLGSSCVLWILFFAFWGTHKNAEAEKKKLEHQLCNPKCPWNPYEEDERWVEANADCIGFGRAKKVTMVGAIVCTLGVLYSIIMMSMTS